MPSDFEFMDKILKDEENKKILFLLKEKEALTYAELMDSLHITQGMLNYHLKTLSDFLAKNFEDKYILSEKGKKAYETLNKYPKKTGVALKWKIIWCAIVTVLIGSMAFAVYVYDYQFISKIVSPFIAALAILAIIYIQGTNSITGAKLLYIIFGAVLLGMLLWFLSWSFANAVKLQGRNLDLFLIASFLVCCSIGGLVGNWFGKKRQYKWPPFITKF